MHHRMSARVALLIIVQSLCALLPQSATACWLFNCWKKSSTPVTAYSPPTTAAVPASSPSGFCGAAQCEQTVLRYVPQVAYRTVWQPVPVTTYRRTVSTNPTTGLPVTCTQPCTTYTYQARRVPYTTFRPVYTTEPVSSPTAAAPAAAAPNTFAPATVPSNADCGCNATPNGWSTVPPATSTAVPPATTTSPPAYTPSYSAPAASPNAAVPGYTPPSSSAAADVPGATPWEPVQPGSASSPTANGQYQSTPGYGTDAADPASDRPRLPPAIDPNLNGGASVAPPANSDAASEDDFVTRGYTPAPSSNNAATTEPTPWTTVRPEVELPPSFPETGSTDLGQSQDATSSSWSPSSTSPRPYTVRPLPQVTTPPPKSESDFDPPPLLNSARDRTAIRPIPARPYPVRWASYRIEWPERLASAESPREPMTSDSAFIEDRPRRLDPHRVRLQRFNSDSSPARSPAVDGWRSAQR